MVHIKKKKKNNLKTKGTYHLLPLKFLININPFYTLDHPLPQYTPPITCTHAFYCVTFQQALHLSMPQLPHLQNGYSVEIHLTDLQSLLKSWSSLLQFEESVLLSSSSLTFTSAVSHHLVSPSS